MARSERFELLTLGIEIRCSIQLSYERIEAWENPARHRNQPGTDCECRPFGMLRLAERAAKQKPNLPSSATEALTTSC